MVLIIGAIIVFFLFLGVILIISGCHDYNEANRGTEIGIGISLPLDNPSVNFTQKGLPLYFSTSRSEKST